MKNRTTKKHFELFKKEAALWIAKLGLRDWQVSFHHEDSKVLGLSRAWYTSSWKNRWAAFGLGVDWGDNDEVTEEKVKIAAFHEVNHVLLSGLCFLTQQRIVTEEQVDAEEHAIIRRLENVFYGHHRKTDKAL